ncbi:hypothetical protein CONCODRAFT_2803 [Conidiobolus coronatus NRRL 28638]|uniref:Uncharacterized protein n=1 Tax=Conidiobolus coronatus (strain ATCC 28846 / CBS 209.66 / NRRL 28638) TaxID=796925 RepID=A0A137PGG5_CONC2|nr:hypothetical protein CONCODRAFT_2803 [Conidiobolus coronatus NRRL 28638]|eukprot:KXN74099.1 hypothetical protein CONCODRAFT_2803 [Conidiobolus coronatus NRRL 28638]
MENIILPPDSVFNEKTSILSQLPKKDFDKLIEGSFRELGNFDAIEVPKTLQLEELDYDLESKWKLSELNRANSPSNLFKVEESRLKSWENSSTMNLFDGRVVELGELTKHNRFDDIGGDENDEESGDNTEDIHLNSSILNESSLISNESEYRSNYLSWDETLNIKQNLRVSDNKFKKLKLIYDELNLDYIESNEINVINISEEELIKEALLLLQLNPNYLFEFNVEQNYFELNMSSDVQFDQSTQEALDLYSTQFLKFSTNWIRLDLVTKTLMELPEIYGQLGLCFAQCLSNYLQLIQFSIIKLSEVKT